MRKRIVAIICAALFALSGFGTPNMVTRLEMNADGQSADLDGTGRIIPVDSGSDLPEVIATITEQDFETVVGFNENGEKILDSTSYLKSRVYTSSVQRGMFAEQGGALLIHNHPSGSSFSSQDLYAEAKYQTPRIMAVSKIFTYTLEPQESGWGDPDEMAAYWQKRYDYYVDYVDGYMEDFRYRVSDVMAWELGDDDGSFDWFCRKVIQTSILAGQREVAIPCGLWVTHQVMQDVAIEFEMEYYRYSTAEYDFTSMTNFQIDPVDSEVLEAA